MPDFAAARKNMVDGVVHTAGITNPLILDAFRNVPRETFVPEALQSAAYTDEDLPLGMGRYLPEPIPHAKMLQALELKGTEKVLDVGGATGYAPTIMSHIARTVVAVDDEEFLNYALHIWHHMDIENIIPARASAGGDYSSHGPYDVIFINGAVAEMPVYLSEQLAPGGQMVAIVKKAGMRMGEATLLRNSVGHKFSSRVLFEAGAHYLPGFEPKPVFNFNN
jgi:protein-L-isoaspartate(D-aspartate) O-methyltransferase